jgi:hypothetical protein
MVKIKDMQVGGLKQLRKYINHLSNTKPVTVSKTKRKELLGFYGDDDKITVLSHDAFGRFDVIRRYYGMGSCDWCGRKGKQWEYGTHSDGYGARPDFARGHFCSKGCSDNYNGR